MLDLSTVAILLPGFCECLVLVGIHAYLGIHVIKRQIIFVDLAIAQIAALGTLVAFLFGVAPHTFVSYWFSLGLATMGAGVFALCRFRDSKVPQEAVIGLVYAIAAAVAILLIDKAPHGAEQLKDILVGTLLWVKWQSIAIAAIVYSAVGVVHYVFRDRFLLISEDPEQARRRGINVRLWDFLFFLLFGVVITLSVDVAGVLIVFVFLVAPAIMALSITNRLSSQLFIGWGLGVVVTVLGLVSSYVWDLPTGPAIIGCYAVVVLLLSAALYNLRASRRAVAIRNTVLTLAAFAAACGLLVVMGIVVQNLLAE
jgi:zinc/manganese transport system permease protein